MGKWQGDGSVKDVAAARPEAATAEAAAAPALLQMQLHSSELRSILVFSEPCSQLGSLLAKLGHSKHS